MAPMELPPDFSDAPSSRPSSSASASSAKVLLAAELAALEQEKAANDAEVSANAFELLEVFYDYPEARRADVIHLREVEVNMMLTGADR